MFCRRYARLVKYAALFLFVTCFALSLNTALASADPLVTVFGKQPRSSVLILGGAVLVLSFFYDRFWCRYLCPAGAFLSLLNGVQGLRRMLPRRYPKLCGYAVGHVRELDCICCDRCRAPGDKEHAFVKQASAHPITHPWGIVCLAALALVAGLVARDALSVGYRRSATAPGAIVAGVGGVSRDADMQTLRARIRQRQLSNHEAMYYDRLPVSTGRDAHPGTRE